MYSDVQVAPNLDIDMSKVEKAVHNYSHNDGQDQGELTESSEYNSEAKGGQAATPGTDSNDDTPTYVTQDGEITESSVSDVDKKYSPNEEIIKTISNGGAINYDNSSIAVTATRWVVYDEEEGLYYCTVSAYGDERQSTYSFPIYVNDEKDTMEITYKYTDRDVIGGKYWAKMISWKYNGVHVYSDDDEPYKKVFIKKANGKTTVSLTR